MQLVKMNMEEIVKHTNRFDRVLVFWFIKASIGFKAINSSCSLAFVSYRKDVAAIPFFPKKQHHTPRRGNVLGVTLSVGLKNLKLRRISLDVRRLSQLGLSSLLTIGLILHLNQQNFDDQHDYLIQKEKL